MNRLKKRKLNNLAVFTVFYVSILVIEVLN